jgi:hypothetical protein
MISISTFPLLSLGPWQSNRYPALPFQTDGKTSNPTTSLEGDKRYWGPRVPRRTSEPLTSDDRHAASAAYGRNRPTWRRAAGVEKASQHVKARAPGSRPAQNANLLALPCLDGIIAPTVRRDVNLPAQW